MSSPPAPPTTPSSLFLDPQSPIESDHHPLSSSPSIVTSDTSDDDFVDDLLDSSSFDKNNTPPMGFTENDSATYLSSGNPCLDFFFQVVPDTEASTVVSLLSSAWAHEPLTALKLVCHLRGVRGTGKSDREGFYASALWLHSHHPKTLALNVASLAEFGYVKDLLEIFYRLIHGPQVRKLAKDVRKQQRRDQQLRLKRLEKEPDAAAKIKERSSKEDRIAAEISRIKIVEEKAAELRRSKRAELASRAVERYSRDPDYRFLHDRISDFLIRIYFNGNKSKPLKIQNSKNSRERREEPEMGRKRKKLWILFTALLNHTTAYISMLSASHYMCSHSQPLITCGQLRFSSLAEYQFGPNCI